MNMTICRRTYILKKMGLTYMCKSCYIYIKKNMLMLTTYSFVIKCFKLSIIFILRLYQCCQD